MYRRTIVTVAAAVMLAVAVQAEEPILRGYRMIKGPIFIKGVYADASGLTYCPDTKSLFMVINGTCEIVEMDLNGKVKRKITTKGFSDLEGITYVGKGYFCVVEEGRATLCYLPIDPAARTVPASTAQVAKIEKEFLGNVGLEGLTVDPVTSTFYIVKEKFPKRIYQVTVKGWNPLAMDVKIPWSLSKRLPETGDVSGVYYHPASRHLLVLSDEGKEVIEMTRDEGKVLYRLPLVRGRSGVLATVPQPEGITMDEQGRLYICSEPNMLYIFAKEPAGKEGKEKKPSSR